MTETFESVPIALVCAAVLFAVCTVMFIFFKRASQEEPFIPSAEFDRKGKKGKAKDAKKKKKQSQQPKNGTDVNAGGVVESNDQEADSAEELEEERESPQRGMKEQKMVEIELDPEIIDSTVKKRKTKKHRKKKVTVNGGVSNEIEIELEEEDEDIPKPILKNRGEKVSITEHAVELPHWKHPKDEVELKRFERQENSKVGPIVPSDSTQDSPGGLSRNKKKKKKKSKAMAENGQQEEVEEMIVPKKSQLLYDDKETIKHVIAPVREAPLDHKVQRHEHVVCTDEPVRAEHKVTMQNASLVQADLEGRLMDQEATIVKLQRQLEKREAEMDATKKRVVGYVPPQQLQCVQEEVNQLRKELADRAKRCDLLQAEFTTNVNRLQTAERARDSAIRQAKGIEEQAKEQQLCFQYSQQEESKLKAENADLRAHLRALENKAGSTDLEDKIKSLQSEKSSFQSRIGLVENELRQMQKHNADKESELQALRQERDELRAAKNHEVEGAQKDYQASLSSKEHQLRQLEEDMHRVRHELDQEKGKVQELTNQLEATRDDYRRSEGEDRHRSEIITGLQGQIDELNTEKNKLLEELTSVRDQMEQTFAANTSASDEQVNELKATIAGLESELANHREQAGNQSDMGALTEKISALEGELASVKVTSESENAKVEELTTKLGEVECHLTQMSSKKDELEGKLCAVEEEKNRLSKELESRGNGNDEEKDRLLKELQDKVCATEEEKCRVTEELEGRLCATEEEKGRLTEELGCHHSQLSSLQEELGQEKTKAEDLAKQLEAEKADFEEQLEHNKTVLANTEQVLERLQASVEEEENKWRSLLKQSEEECDLLRAQIERAAPVAKESVTDLNFAYNCVERSLTSIVDEMETRLKDAETKYEELVHERDDLNTKLEEAASHETLHLEAVRSQVCDLEKRLHEAQDNLAQRSKAYEEVISERASLATQLETAHAQLEVERRLVLEMKEGGTQETDAHLHQDAVANPAAGDS